MRRTILAIFACLVFSTSAHSQLIGSGNEAEEITLQGQVTEFSFQSRLSSIKLLVSDSSGVNNWTIEAPSAIQLRKLGWDSNSLFTGEIIRVRALINPNTPFQAELINLTKANGALLLAKSQPSERGIDLSNIPSGTYRLDKNQAFMFFSFDHRGFSKPKLRFDRFDAILNFDSQDPASSSVRVDVDVSSLSSGNASLDRELRDEALFDSLNHPKISFVSTSISINAWGRAKVRGELDIKGQKKDVIFDAQINRTGVNPDTNKPTIGVSLSGVVERSKWGLDSFRSIASDRVQIQIEAEFIQ